MGEWILCKDALPPINTFVLVFTDEYQFPYKVMKYCGKRTRTCYDTMNEWEEEYNCWSETHGERWDSNPVAWQFINDFMKYKERREWQEKINIY